MGYSCLQTQDLLILSRRWRNGELWKVYYWRIYWRFSDHRHKSLYLLEFPECLNLFGQLFFGEDTCKHRLYSVVNTVKYIYILLYTVKKSPAALVFTFLHVELFVLQQMWQWYCHNKDRTHCDILTNVAASLVKNMTVSEQPIVHHSIVQYYSIAHFS